MPAVYTASGAKGLAITKLRRMLSLSDALQTKTGLSESELLERVYLRSAPVDAQMPFAVIGSSPLRWVVPSGGDQNHMRPSGVLMLMIQCEPDESQDSEIDQRHEAEDFLDSVIADVAGLSAADDASSEDGTSHLAINNIEPDGPMMEVPEETAGATGRFYWATWTIDWGYPS